MLWRAVCKLCRMPSPADSMESSGQERGDENKRGEGGSINWHRVAGRTGFSVAKKGQRKLYGLKCDLDSAIRILWA